MKASASESIEIRQLSSNEIRLIGDIDRSEHIDTLYTVEEGRLVDRPVDIDVPPWDREGIGEHSAGALIEHFQPLVVGGADLLGAFDQDEFLGLAIVDDRFEVGVAWLALLHVSRRYRRRGVASALWSAAKQIAVDAGAESMYVSATPSNSAVGFYLSRGCQLAQPPHPVLLAEEPEDCHFVCPIG
ncbi:MAG: GNAT family N-acetyltransferase [Actinomycetota bacterium]|nr:GNAT family N-acetyltransferase [Actinomycetota bacterium]